MADDTIRLSTDGPHSPEYTAEVGNALAECARVLNRATLGDAPGLRYPSHADRLLRDVTITLDRMPQLIEQTRAWLRARSHAGHIGHDQGAGAVEAVTEADAYLIDAVTALGAASGCLDAATARTSHLTGIDPERRGQ